MNLKILKQIFPLIESPLKKLLNVLIQVCLVMHSKHLMYVQSKHGRNCAWSSSCLQLDDFSNN